VYLTSMIDLRVVRHTLRIERVSRALALTVVCLAGCQTTPAPAPRELPPTIACLVVEDSARPQLNVAIHWPIDPSHAPSPSHSAERLVFRQLYETLVNVDCDGRIRPGLAESWKVDVSGRVWDFQLRPDATFWDGAQVTADAVVESWKTNTRSPTISSFASMTARGERELQVELKTPFVEAHLFARPDVAVTRNVATGPWPLGSGPLRVDPNSNANLVRVTARTGAARLQAIDFRTFSGDARIALDARVDAVVTAEPSVLQYARQLPDYELVPLTWSRTYVLARPGADTASFPPPDAMSALGRDAVRADSRPAVQPFWWRLSECRTAAERSVTTQTGGYSNTITYPRRDAIARAIAERLVALAWPVNRAPDWLRNLLAVAYGNEGPPVARGLDDPELLAALARGDALAFVISSPRSQGRICAPHFAPEDAIARTLTSGNLQVTPMLDVREYLVQRRGLGRVVVDSDGTIRIQGGRP
jgi:extracellular solute-binding protein (family 5)